MKKVKKTSRPKKIKTRRENHRERKEEKKHKR
jgi:hypothetical protein